MDPRGMIVGLLAYAPQFILSNFDTVIIGVVAAYYVLIVFAGPGSFFHRLWQVTVALAVAYGIGRVVRFGIARGVRLIDSSSVVPGREERSAKPTTSAAAATADRRSSASDAKPARSSASSSAKVQSMD